MESLLEIQRAHYASLKQDPPPLLPHGEDVNAVRPKLTRRHVPKQIHTIPARPPAAAEGTKPLTASDLPEGFPPELAFRALAAYSLLRTLGVELRLAPFTPNVFLRALYLPFPNRLLGKVHVALLRILLSNLQMGYHWSDKSPPLDVVKKRLIDGLKWPLRAGDCLRLLDTYTWPVFYDDYCHLTSDVLHAFLHDKTDYAEQRNLNVTGMDADRRLKESMPSQHGDKMVYGNSASKKVEILYLNASDNEDSSSEDEFQPVKNEEKDDEEEDDDDDDYIDKSSRGRKKSLKGKHHKGSLAGGLRRSSTGSSRQHTPKQQTHVPNQNGASQGKQKSVKSEGWLQQPMQFQYGNGNWNQPDYRQHMINQTSGAYGDPSYLGSPYVNYQYMNHMYMNPAAAQYQQYQMAYTMQQSSNQNSIAGNLQSSAFLAPHSPFISQQFHGTPQFTSSMPTPTPDVVIAIEPVKVKRQALVQTFVDPIFGDPGTEELDFVNGKIKMAAVRSGGIDHGSVENFPRRKRTSEYAVPLISDVEKGKDVGVTLPASVGLKQDESKIPLSACSAKKYSDEHILLHENREPKPPDNLSLLASFIRGETDSFQPMATHMTISSNPVTRDESAICPDPFLDKIHLWPQFDPIFTMRSGVPYHRLSIDHKLNILEFLIDEIVDIFSDVFSQRRSQTNYHPTPYSKLPSQEDLKSLENDDECYVCKQEGDLICCDGCVSSYHKRCLDLPDGDLPDGRWLCPDCMLRDPAAFGPLRGGKKCALDWFTVDDVSRAHNKGDHTIDASSAEKNDTLDLSITDQVAVAHRTTDDVELLVVHGFVFRRPRANIDRTNTLSPMSSSELKELLLSLGPTTSSRWPLAQIPFENSLFATSESLSLSPSYFRGEDGRFNPNYYANKYRKAPLPPWVRSFEAASTCEYEIRCGTATTNVLSSVLSSEMSRDHAIRSSLRASTILFDPYKMITTFLLRIETDLLKASLLDEFWRTRETSGEAKSWSHKVRNCLSVRRLAKMLLEIIDATHPRAFFESWFHVPALKGKTADLMKGPERRITLTDDFLPKHETMRRNWERCPASAVSILVGKEHKSLDEFIHEVRPDLRTFSTRSNKRKQFHGHFSTQRALDGSGVAVKPSTAPEGNSEAEPVTMDSENLLAGSLRKRVSRRSDRYQYERSPEGAKNSKTKDVSSICIETLVHDEKKRTVSKLADDLKSNVTQEGHWQLAGRRLFDPVGYISKSSCRHLARNAGCLPAPFVTYLSAYEVGQVSFHHIWRKRVLRCVSFEELLLSIRVVESFLDQAAIRKCAALAHRFRGLKAGSSSEILCTQRDVQTGLDYHLVGKSGQKNGIWVSCMSIDLAPLILERCKRRKARVKVMSEKIRLKEVARIKEEIRIREEKRRDDEAKRKEELRKREEAKREELRLKKEALKLKEKEMRNREKEMKQKEKTNRDSDAKDTSSKTARRTHVPAKRSIPVSLNPMNSAYVSNGAGTAQISLNFTQPGAQGQIPVNSVAGDQIYPTPIGQAHFGPGQPVPGASKRKPAGQRRPKKEKDPSAVTASSKKRKRAEGGKVSENSMENTAKPMLPLNSDSMTQCPEILANHITQAQGLIRKYGPWGVPQNELDGLRRESESRLSNVLQQGGVNYSREKISEVIAFAETDALRLESNSSTGVNENGQNFRSMEALNSILIAVQTSQPTNESAKPASQSDKSTKKAKALPREGSERTEAKSERQSTKTASKPAASKPRKATKKPSAHMESTMSSSQVISHHHAEVTKLIQNSGVTYPSHELDRIRKDSESKLVAALLAEGVTSSSEQLRAVLMQVEAHIVSQASGRANAADGAEGIASKVIQNSTEQTQNENSASKKDSDGGFRWNSFDLSDEQTQGHDSGLAGSGAAQAFTKRPKETNQATQQQSQKQNQIESASYPSTGTPISFGEQVRNHHKNEIKNLIEKYGAGLPQNELQRIRRANEAKLNAAYQLDGAQSITSEILLAVLMKAESEVITEITERSKTSGENYAEMPFSPVRGDSSTTSSDRNQSSPNPPDQLYQYGAQDTNHSLQPQVQNPSDSNNHTALGSLFQAGVDTNEYNSISRLEGLQQLESRSATRLPHQLSLSQQEEAFALGSQGHLRSTNQTTGWLAPEVRNGLLHSQYSALLNPLADSSYDQHRTSQSWQDSALLANTHQFSGGMSSNPGRVYDPLSSAGMELQMGGYGFQPPATSNSLQQPSASSYLSLFSQGLDQNLNAGVANDILDIFQQQNAFDADSLNHLNSFGSGGFHHG